MPNAPARALGHRVRHGGSSVARLFPSGRCLPRPRATMTQKLRRWIAARMDGYLLLVAALGLNLPLMAVALVRHLRGVPLMSLAGLYAGLVIVGYYGLMSLLLLTALFALTWFSSRLWTVTGIAFLFLTASYLVINSVVYRAFRFHVDAFWVGYIVTSLRETGVRAPTLAVVGSLLAGLVAFEWGMLEIARRLRSRRSFALALALGVVACFVA